MEILMMTSHDFLLLGLHLSHGDTGRVTLPHSHVIMKDSQILALNGNCGTFLKIRKACVEIHNITKWSISYG